MVFLQYTYSFTLYYNTNCPSCDVCTFKSCLVPRASRCPSSSCHCLSSCWGWVWSKVREVDKGWWCPWCWGHTCMCRFSIHLTGGFRYSWGFFAAELLQFLPDQIQLELGCPIGVSHVGHFFPALNLDGTLRLGKLDLILSKYIINTNCPSCGTCTLKSCPVPGASRCPSSSCCCVSSRWGSVWMRVWEVEKERLERR
jgi:hypothetical protein